jgi:hypothetical protein
MQVYILFYINVGKEKSAKAKHLNNKKQDSILVCISGFNLVGSEKYSVLV